MTRVLPSTAPMGGLSEVPSWTEPTRIIVINDPEGHRMARLEFVSRSVTESVLDAVDGLAEAVIDSCRPKLT